MLLTRRMGFSASHRVWRPDWDESRNRASFGAEARSEFHGHDYTLEVTLSGSADPETGMVINLKCLSDIMEREVANRFDHRNLNEDTLYFHERVPTAENLADVLFGLLDRALPDRLLHRIRLSPTRDLCVEVSR